MFFLFEPINMYATNIDDFWFDFFIMIEPCIIIFTIYFLALSLFYVLLFVVNKIFSEKLYIYEIGIVVGFILIIIAYIHGNFLIADLPSLTGIPIIWNTYEIDYIRSLAIIISSSIIGIYAAYKFKFEKFAKIFSFISLAIFLMLGISLLFTMLTNDTFEKKERYLVTTAKNINNASTDKNFYILLFDAVDSKIFNEILENSENKNTFNDFTYYPDTMSAYAYTRDSIPFILSGIWNENEMSFRKYSDYALDQSRLIDALNNEEYLINIYTEELNWNTDKALKVDNLVNTTGIDEFIYFKNIFKYIKFKYLPYQLKKYSKIEELDFYDCIETENSEHLNCTNKYFYNFLITEEKINKIDDKYFGLLYVEGGHQPFNIDKDINYVENGTYEQKLEGTLTIITKFIDRLKANDVYDNSVIIIISDHGYNYSSTIGRQNPILFIKGIDEHHKMKISDIPVSFEDLQDVYQQLLSGDKSTDLFKNIDVNRKRRFLLYEFETPEHMIEYEQTGTADNEDTLIPTGREFNK